jgi:hypothetical protein
MEQPSSVARREALAASAAAASDNVSSLPDDCLQELSLFLKDADLLSLSVTCEALRSALLREPVFHARCRLLSRRASSWSWGGERALNALYALLGSWRAAYSFLASFGLGLFRGLLPGKSAGFLAELRPEGAGGALVVRVLAPRDARCEQAAGVVLVGGLPAALRLTSAEGVSYLTPGALGCMYAAPPWVRDVCLGRNFSAFPTPDASWAPLNPRWPFALEPLPNPGAGHLRGAPPLLAGAAGLFEGVYGVHGAEVILFTVHDLAAECEVPPMRLRHPDFLDVAVLPEEGARASELFFAFVVFLRQVFGGGMGAEETTLRTCEIAGGPTRSMFRRAAAAAHIVEGLPPVGCRAPPQFVLLGRKVTGDRNVPSGQVTVLAALEAPQAGAPGAGGGGGEEEPHLVIRGTMQCNLNPDAWAPYGEAFLGRVFANRLVLGGITYTRFP